MNISNPKKDSGFVQHDSTSVRSRRRFVGSISSMMVDWELFRVGVRMPNRDLSKGGRPPFDPVLMLKVVLHGRSITISVMTPTEFQMATVSASCKAGLCSPGTALDEKTIWDFKPWTRTAWRTQTVRVLCFAAQWEGMIAVRAVSWMPFVDAPRQRNQPRAERADQGRVSAPKALRPTPLKAGKKIAMVVGRRKTLKLITDTRTTPRWMRKQVGSRLQEHRSQRA